MMASMAEFVCRANYGLTNGSFELDMRDGEIRFKSFVDCEGTTPTAEMIRNSIHCPAAMFERYSAGIVVLGNATVKEAIVKCEKSLPEEFRSILSEELYGSKYKDAVIALLAAELGVDESDLLADDEQPESTDDGTKTKTELFET